MCDEEDELEKYQRDMITGLVGKRKKPNPLSKQKLEYGELDDWMMGEK